MSAITRPSLRSTRKKQLSEDWKRNQRNLRQKGRRSTKKSKLLKDVDYTDWKDRLHRLGYPEIRRPGTRESGYPDIQISKSRITRSPDILFNPCNQLLKSV